MAGNTSLSGRGEVPCAVENRFTFTRFAWQVLCDASQLQYCRGQVDSIMMAVHLAAVMHLCLFVCFTTCAIQLVSKLCEMCSISKVEALLHMSGFIHQHLWQSDSGALYI